MTYRNRRCGKRGPYTSQTIPSIFFLVSFRCIRNGFPPNCGRPYDHPRWADGDPLARAFIIEMKDDLAVYLTNMNAAIHGKGTSLKGTLLDGEHRKKYEKMYNRLLVWRIEEIMYVELPKRQREKEVKWSNDTEMVRNHSCLVFSNCDYQF